MNFFEIKECPNCKELRHKETGFKKHARVCVICERKRKKRLRK